MKRSKFVAMVLLCALALSVAQPVFARTWGEFFTDTGVGAAIGIAAGGALAFFSGGASIPFTIPLMAGVGGGAAVGAAVGAAPEDQRVEMAGLTLSILSFFGFSASGNK